MPNINLHKNKRSIMLGFGAALLLAGALLVANYRQSVQAEVAGGSCVVANQATKDQLSTQAPYDQIRSPS